MSAHPKAQGLEWHLHALISPTIITKRSQRKNEIDKINRLKI